MGEEQERKQRLSFYLFLSLGYIRNPSFLNYHQHRRDVYRDSILDRLLFSHHFRIMLYRPLKHAINYHRA